MKLSKLYCQTLLIIAKEDYFKYRNDIFEKVNSLLNIAKAIGNKDVLSEAVKALIDFERRHETALGDYAWRRSFELLVLDKKIKLSEEDENQIVCGIEKVFLRLIEEEVKLGNCPWSDIIKLGMLLGAYYKSNMNNHKKAQDVIRKAGHVCEEFANLNTGVNREMILRELYQTYLKVSLKDEAECVARLIKENGTEILSSMTMTESVIEIPHEVIKNYVDDIFKRNDKNNAIRELIKDNLPTTEMLCNQIRINKKEAPLLSIIAHINYSSDGVLMSYREPSTEDLCSEDDLVAELKNYLFIHILFFEKCLKEIFKQGHINEQVLLEFIASTHIRDKRRPIIKRGIEAYFANDFMTFLHLIIPQIEAILRNILEDNGGTVLKDGREGGFNYKTLDSLLGEEAVCEKLGEDLTRYLKGVYSHRLGLNLRNDICHGLWETKEGNKLESALVLHTLLCLTHLE